MAHRTSTRSEVRLHSVVPISYLMHNNTHAAVSKSSPDQSYHFPHHLPHPVQSLQTRRSKRLIFVICNQRSFSGCKYPVKITPDFFPLCFFACCIGYICTQMNKYKKKKKNGSRNRAAALHMFVSTSTDSFLFLGLHVHAAAFQGPLSQH